MLSSDFKEFFQSLNDNGVRYLVIGGYAVAIHGHPRYTKDIDVWIERSPDNAVRMEKAIVQFGFASLQLTAQDFLELDQFVQLGFPPNRIDILNSTLGVEFTECYENKLGRMLDGVNVSFISLQDLIKNKQAVARPQDIVDLGKLK